MEPLEARDLFALAGHCIFLNHAGTSPLSARSRAIPARTRQVSTPQRKPKGSDRKLPPGCEDAALSAGPFET